jgi:hypothetical protein
VYTSSALYSDTSGGVTAKLQTANGANTAVQMFPFSDLPEDDDDYDDSILHVLQQPQWLPFVIAGPMLFLCCVLNAIKVRRSLKRRLYI